MQVQIASYATQLQLHTQDLTEIEESLPRLAAAASLKLTRLATSAVLGIITAFLFVWVAGLVLELVWFYVAVADNLRRIRRSGDPSQPNRE